MAEGTSTDRERSYHDPRYRVILADLLLGLAVTAALAFTSAGQDVLGIVDGLPAVLGAFLLGVLIVVLSALVRLPLTVWLGLLHERRFGFSRESTAAFALDRLKAVTIDSVLTGAALAGLVLCARAFPSAWPLVAGIGAALLVLLLSFVAPVVLEPVFNRFRPLEDSGLRDAVFRLADRSGVPVREVLVADASRRTTKLNAYVSGLGATRRVVLYDTLVEKASEPEVLTVVAHELGHRRFRHVAFGTAIAMAEQPRTSSPSGHCSRRSRCWTRSARRGRGIPRSRRSRCSSGSLLGLAAAPLHAALSRRWEYACDRFALEQTGDLGAFELAFGQLSESNLPDSAPPHLAYLWLFSHPTIPERLAAARRAAALGTVPA